MKKYVISILVIINMQFIFSYELNPPINLTTEVIENDVNLSWEQPLTGEGTGWISRGNNTYDFRLGKTQGGIWYVASPFSAEDISLYSGSILTKVKFYPKDASADYSICIWTSPPWLENYIVEHPVANPIIDNWTEVILPDPIEIFPGNELWIGYKIDQEPSTYPAGIDSAPSEAGLWANVYGVWVDYSHSYYDHNWLIQGLLEDPSGRSVIIERSNFSPYIPVNYDSHPSLSINEVLISDSNPARIRISDNDRSLLGYNVYRDNVLVYSNTNPSELSFTDIDLSNATYSYYVTANYDSGESVGSDVKYAIVSESEISDLFFFESTALSVSLPDLDDSLISSYWQRFHPERSGTLENIKLALCPSFGTSTNGVLSLGIYFEIGGILLHELNFDTDGLTEDGFYEFDFIPSVFSFSAMDDFWIKISFNPDSVDDQLWFYCGAQENGIDVFYDYYSAFEKNSDYYWWMDTNENYYDEINMIAEVVYEEELVYHESHGGVCNLPDDDYGDINYWQLFYAEQYGSLEKLKLHIAPSTSSNGILYFDIFDERGGNILGGLGFDTSLRRLTDNWQEFDMSSLNFSFQPYDEFWIRMSFSPSSGSDVLSFYRGQFENGNDIVWNEHSYFEYNGSYSYWYHQADTENWSDEINLTAIVDYDVFEWYDISVNSVSFENFFLQSDAIRANVVYESVIKNNGTIPAYNLAIGKRIYDLTNGNYIPIEFQVINLLPGESQSVVFDPWIYSMEGDYNVKIYSGCFIR